MTQKHIPFPRKQAIKCKGDILPEEVGRVAESLAAAGEETDDGWLWINPHLKRLYVTSQAEAAQPAFPW